MEICFLNLKQEKNTDPNRWQDIDSIYTLKQYDPQTEKINIVPGIGSVMNPDPLEESVMPILMKTYNDIRDAYNAIGKKKR